jgi:hypothetical protein
MKPRVARRVLTFVAPLAAMAAALGAAGYAAAPADAASYPPYPAELIVKSELRLKANLVARNLKRSPQLVFFGGSRSQRFDPAFAQKRTGLRAVNIALSCARPEAAWGYLNWFYARWPGAEVRWVWGMQSGMLRDRDMDPALLQDKRFYRYFPDDLLARQRALLPSRAKMPKHYGFLRNRYAPRGLLLRNRYDQRRAAGYTLDQSLDAYIARMLRTAKAEAAPATRARTYFEDTVRLLNEHGTTPVIVLMPIHPRVLRVMKQYDMGDERQLLRDYLAELANTLSIKVLDFTTISSFNGKPEWFYDGVHITRRNTERVIVAVKGKAGEYLK